MNSDKKVLAFTMIAAFLLTAYSLAAIQFNLQFLSLKNINSLSDVVVKPPTPGKHGNTLQKEHVHPAYVTNRRSIGDYPLPHVIMNFSADTQLTALPHLMDKLQQLRGGKKARVRIAWFGDSMIEADLLTQTVRKHLQQAFGNNYCVGYLPIKSVVAKLRTSASDSWQGDWQEGSFHDNKLGVSPYLSGHVFFSGDGTVALKDNTLADTNTSQVIVKSLLCGKADAANVSVNGHQTQILAGNIFNRIVLDSSTGHAITLNVKDNKLPVYGLSFEAASGVVLDNYSFRGITGVELAKLDTAMLQDMDRQRYYDVIVLEYGANLMFRPYDSSYTWYRQHMEKVLKTFRRVMPNTDFLVISTADRAFNYDGEWRTAVGIDSLIYAQAMLAYDNNMAFYNMYESMGGEGTITQWASMSPTRASPDHVHPNHVGAAILGDMFFDDLMKDFNKVNQLRK